jgi:hypothetical protein
LRGFPREEEVLEDLAKALTISAPNEAAAEEFITEWIRVNTFVPVPAAIYAAFPPPTVYWQRPPETQCSLCGDSGWKPVQRGGYSAVTPCECKKIRLVKKN